MSAETPACATCAAHPLVETNLAAMRQTLDAFIAAEGVEHAKLRDHMARQSDTFHAELLEVARTAHVRPEAPEGAPHPLQRADDYEQRVVLQLSRKDLFKVLGAVALIVALCIGLALIAGRDGLDLWHRTVAPTVPGK